MGALHVRTLCDYARPRIRPPRFGAGTRGFLHLAAALWAIDVGRVGACAAETTDGEAALDRSGASVRRHARRRYEGICPFSGGVSSGSIRR
jgi:hypothetical protein